MNHTFQELSSKHENAYLFVLQEGKSIKDDPLDYSLLLLQTTNPETIAPSSHKITISLPMPNRHEVIYSPCIT